MALYTIPNATTIDGALVQISSSVPSFVPLLLMFIFFTVMLSGYFSQKKRTGRGDFPMWSVLASISTLMVASIMTLISGLILLKVLIVVVVVTIFTGAWFLMNKNRYEV